METHIGRARFQGSSMRFNDSEARLERELYPNADPGTDPDPGKSMDEEIPPDLMELIKQIEALGYSITVVPDSPTGPTADEEKTPMQKFKSASDKRWGIGARITADATVDTSSMSPIQSFAAASKRRWAL